MRWPIRREGWLYGRLLAKQLLATQAGELDPSRIDVVSQDGLGRSVRPWVLEAGRTRVGVLSIAHSTRSVLTALATEPGVTVGVDLTAIGSVDERIVELWFRESERAWVASAGLTERARRAATIWALKEAVYKATNAGEQFRPAGIAIHGRPKEGLVAEIMGAVRQPTIRTRVLEVDDELAVIVTSERGWRQGDA
jgi:phosphopantetheinyl transferase (holo-ACP synthase)